MKYIDNDNFSETNKKRPHVGTKYQLTAAKKRRVRKTRQSNCIQLSQRGKSMKAHAEYTHVLQTCSHLTLSRGSASQGACRRSRVAVLFMGAAEPIPIRQTQRMERQSGTRKQRGLRLSAPTHTKEIKQPRALQRRE